MRTSSHSNGLWTRRSHPSWRRCSSSNDLPSSNSHQLHYFHRLPLPSHHSKDRRCSQHPPRLHPSGRHRSAKRSHRNERSRRSASRLPSCRHLPPLLNNSSSRSAATRSVPHLPLPLHRWRLPRASFVWSSARELRVLHSPRRLSFGVEGDWVRSGSRVGG